MKDWMKPLAPKPRNNRQTYFDNSGSMLLEFELVNEITETDAAHFLIFVLDGTNIGRWLPKSQIKIPYADVVKIPRWLVDRIKEEVKLYGQADKQQA